MKNLVCVAFLLSCLVTGWCSDEPQRPAQLIVFFSPTCHTCQKAKQEIIPKVSTLFPGRFQVQFRDLSDMDTYMYLLNLEEQHSVKLDNVTPIFYMNGSFLNGRGLDALKLERFVRAALERQVVTGGGPSKEDLVKRFLKFTPLIIAGAGLVDGINPCAFTVIVFFISFLAVQGYRKRELIIIGGLFIGAVFITYLLLGLGVFSFLYALQGIWHIIKVINIVIGIFSIVLGCLALIDGISFFCSGGKTDQFFLQLPESVKKQIHGVIGVAYRKDTGGGTCAAHPHVIRLGMSAVVTGFLVSLLEAVCTGQTYVPTIAFVLKTSSLQLPAFALLVLYNLMFIVPLVIVFVLALLGTTSQQFAGFMRRHMLVIKIAMAVFFLLMGLFLLGGL
ncbi:MAG TPA: hypothetical protein PKL77_05125 [Candidatus Omnitrophota bacterium]|nr:hypothetical protein [Candidatus Omnitrophota bacterium]